MFFAGSSRSKGLRGSYGAVGIHQLCQTALLEFQAKAKNDPSLFNMAELAKCIDTHCDSPGLFRRVDNTERVGKFSTETMDHFVALCMYDGVAQVFAAQSADGLTTSDNIIVGGSANDAKAANVATYQGGDGPAGSDGSSIQSGASTSSKKRLTSNQVLVKKLRSASKLLFGLVLRTKLGQAMSYSELTRLFRIAGPAGVLVDGMLVSDQSGNIDTEGKTCAEQLVGDTIFCRQHAQGAEHLALSSL